MFGIPGPMEIIFLIMLGGGFGISPGMPPAEEAPLALNAAPAECLFYTSWAGTSVPDADSSNQTEQLLAEKEFQAYRAASRTQLLNLIQQMTARQADARQAIVDTLKLFEFIQDKPGAIYISELSFSGNGPSKIKGAGLILLDDDTDKAKALLDKLQAHAPKDQISAVEIGDQTFSRILFGKQTPPIVWGMSGKYLLVGIGDESLSELLKRASGDPPAWLKDIRARLSVPRISSVTYLNVKRLIDIATQGADSPKAVQIISALGFDKLDTFASINGLDETGCVTKTLLRLDGETTGLLAWFDLPAIKAGDLAPVSSDVLAAAVVKLDAAWLFDVWLKTLNKIDPREAKQAREMIEVVGRQLGINVREGFLKSIGDTWRLFIQPTGPGALLHGWTLAVEVRDRDKLKRAQDAIVKTMKNGLQRCGSDVPTLKTATLDGREIHTLDFAPVGLPIAPTWCLTDSEFLLTTMPQTLEPILSGLIDQSLAQQPDVAPLVDKDAKTLAFLYVDTKGVIETLLPKLPELLQGVGPVMPMLNTMNLPSSKVFLRHAQPSMYSMNRKTDGVEFVSRSTLPGSSVGPTVPIAVAMAIPAIGSARRVALHAQGTNQLKHLGLAMHCFHDTHNAFPAGYSADKDGKPLLSWRVYMLPYLERTDLFEQFHLDEPWDSPHNKKLIEKMPDAFRAVGSKAKPGMTNYLGVGGADGVFVRPAPGSHYGTAIRDIKDGTSNTIMIVEVPDESAIIWTKPGDFAPNKKDPTRGLVGLRPTGFLAGFTDGSVQFVSKDIDAKLLHALFTKAGGEPVNDFWRQAR